MIGPTEEEKRLHRCCFTGHRPEKLNASEEEVKGFDEFIKSFKACMAVERAAVDSFK